MFSNDIGVLVLTQIQKGFGSFVMTSSTEVSHVEDTEKGFLYMSILVVHARHTDYGHPIKQTFGLGQTIWSDKFWGI